MEWVNKTTKIDSGEFIARTDETPYVIVDDKKMARTGNSAKDVLSCVFLVGTMVLFVLVLVILPDSAFM